MSDLRAILEKAELDINTFKHPNVDEAHVWLDNILVAAGLPGIRHNRIDFLSVDYNDEVSVTSSWSCRGCQDQDTYSFPAYIIDAVDPIKAAMIWGLEQRLAEVKNSIANLKAGLLEKETKRDNLEAQLKELT